MLLTYPANIVFHVKGFSTKCQKFPVSKKMHLQTFLYGYHPNDSLIIKVIYQIMDLCIKITWYKNHDNILFGQCENAFTINFLYVGHPNGTPQDYENSQKSSRRYT